MAHAQLVRFSQVKQDVAASVEGDESAELVNGSDYVKFPQGSQLSKFVGIDDPKIELQGTSPFMQI
jgi:hypothetical protein